MGDWLSAAATLLICLLAIHLLMKVLRRLAGKSKLDVRVQRYLLSGLKLVLYIITGIIVVDSLGIPVTSLVAILSVGSWASPWRPRIFWATWRADWCCCPPGRSISET